MSKATGDLMESLHGAVCATLLARVNDPEAKPADISNAIKFLKDNGIDQVPTEDNGIGKMLEGLPFDTLMDSALDSH